MDQNKRNEIIRYRVEQSENTIEEARILLDNNMLKASVNRMYYGMFYIVTALAIKRSFETSKHNQLIGCFNKNFIKTKTLDRKFGLMLKEAFEHRQHADYAVYIEFTKEECENKFDEMQLFIHKIKELIHSPE